MLFVPTANEFNWILDSVSPSTRPAVIYGTQVPAPAAPFTYGSWVSLISTPTQHDAFGILVHLSVFGITSTNRQALVDIGIDTAGGASFSVSIPSLLAGHACNFTQLSGGMYYYFPLFIPAGSTIGARAVANITNAGGYARVVLFGKPSNPEAVKTGTKVRAVGVNIATASAVSVTQGTVSDGAWTSLGTIPNDAWWFQLGASPNLTSVIGATMLNSLSCGANRDVIIQNMLTVSTTAEVMGNVPVMANCVKNIQAGTELFAKCRSSANAYAYVMAAYALSD